MVCLLLEQKGNLERRVVDEWLIRDDGLFAEYFECDEIPETIDS